jgi:hypothetical protein
MSIYSFSGLPRFNGKADEYQVWRTKFVAYLDHKLSAKPLKGSDDVYLMIRLMVPREISLSLMSRMRARSTKQ